MSGYPMRWIAPALLALAAAAGADVLETRDGRLLEGTYLGGTQQAVRFQVAGNVEVVPVGQILAVTFTERTAAAPPGAPAATPQAPQAAAPATPAAAPAPKLARVPAGTWLRVRMTHGIDPRQSAVDDRFDASLETALGTGNTVVVPAGTQLQGRVAELRATGPVASRLKLELTQLVHRGQPIEIVTGSHQLPRAAAASETVTVDGNPGPADASTIPVRPGVTPGTVLEFRLLQPFDIRLQ